ncbi:rhodanese-related sulfurtransferase [Acaryochloris sp. IP29b_bin.137]|uniref:oxygen-dependent tRNA uridine(34) hydroxylase TrhO n=1 Tax=Acaryochloris sp. IP29b_bin.137 TaxID=2969217 RepID=UPI002637A501|nr:rhodanese-related sulfurtransferase [Acaryochloris sp. IP29b_bin.137]
MAEFLTVAFYKFVELQDYKELKAPLLSCCEDNNVQGTILLATEGINGAIAGLPHNIQAVLDFLRKDSRFADLAPKESWSEKRPFYRMKVRLKKEIIKMGVPDIDPTQTVGEYVKPEDWNQLLADPNVVIIDVRNDYEVAIGTFKGAVNPNTQSFSELPQWLQAQAELQKKPKVAMFCTGGIRCEKSTALLRHQGFEEVYHLQGGILSYLEKVPESESLWQGDCFVFDERVAVGHGLKPGRYQLCRACRTPISPEDMASEHYVPGQSCPHCHGTQTETQKQRFAERQRQMELAKQRNQVHIGAKYARHQLDPNP